jgi:carbon monoxide dehydrogenase subunit G
MGLYRSTFRIEAPVEMVWQLMSDPNRLSEWNGAFDRIENASGRLDEVGTTYTQVTKVAGIELKGDWEITSVEPMRRRQFSGKPPGFSRCKGVESFEAANGGTEYTVEFDYALWGGPIGTVADRLYGRSLMERIIERNIEQLRLILEA